jgi:hypothetical protein
MTQLVSDLHDPSTTNRFDLDDLLGKSEAIMKTTEFCNKVSALDARVPDKECWILVWGMIFRTIASGSKSLTCSEIVTTCESSFKDKLLVRFDGQSATSAADLINIKEEHVQMSQDPPAKIETFADLRRFVDSASVVGGEDQDAEDQVSSITISTMDIGGLQMLASHVQSALYMAAFGEQATIFHDKINCDLLADPAPLLAS